MRLRQLGCSDMKITSLGVGTWAIGGPSGNYNWGAQDDAESISAIRRALELGMNWIDTAPVYGKGHSEEVVGKAVQGLKAKPYIFTKCSLLWGADGAVGNSLKADSIRKECEASLRRLGVERLDLWQIHWPNPDADIEEGWGEMAKLQKAGKVRWIGLSNFSPDQMRRCQAIAPVASLQPPYSAVRRDIEKDVLPFCAKENIGVLVYSPMQAGLLSGRMTRERIAAMADTEWRKHNLQFTEPNLTRNLALQDAFTKIAARHGHPAGVAAIAWTLRNPVVTGAIVGVRNAKQAEELAPALEFSLSPEELKEIEGLLPA